MVYISGLICLLGAFIYYYQNSKRWFNIGSLMCFEWGMVLLVNAVSPFDWFPISDKTKMYLLVSAIVLTFGLFPKKRVLTFGRSNRAGLVAKKTVINQQSLNPFFSVQIILFIVMIPMIIKALRLMLSNNFDLYVLRSLYASGGEEGSYMSTLERLIYIHYIVGPCSMACILLDAILCFKNNFWKKPLIYMFMLAAGMSIYTAARTTLFFTIIVLGFSFFCRYSMNRKKKTISEKREKRRIWIILIIVVLVMGIMTVLRGNSSQNPLLYIVRTVVTYFCAGVRVLDQTLINPSNFGLTEYTFGLCTFSGLIGIIAFFDTYILGAVGFNLLPYGFSATTIAQGYLYNNIRYGTKSSMNAFPTMFYYFLRDGGVFFLVVAVFIFMRVLRSAEFRFKRSQTIKNQFIYGMLFFAAIMSVCWWEPMRTEFWTIFIWGLVLCKFFQKREIINEL